VQIILIEDTNVWKESFSEEKQKRFWENNLTGEIVWTNPNASEPFVLKS
jgi:hypothetical protein